MKRLTLSAVFFAAFNLVSFAQDTTRVWVTINDPAVLDPLAPSAFQTIIQGHSVFSVKLALPAAHTPALRKVYELVCACDNTDLVNDLIGVYGTNEPVAVNQPTTLYLPNDYTATFADDYALDLINAQGAWDITTGNPAIKLGITDTNFDFTHPELTGGKIVAGGDTGFSDYIHGTAVAITAAGNTDNGVGKSSIGFDCSLVVESISYNGMLAARDAGARVVNASWYASCFPDSYGQGVLDELYNDGVVVIVSAGNGYSTCGDPAAYAYPAAYNHAIAVTSIGYLDNHESPPGAGLATTHQHNDKVDLSSPGYLVNALGPNGAALPVNGTSFAAPYVTGTVGLMLSVNPCLTVDQVEYILKATSVNVDALNPAYAGLLGAGRLDAEAAVLMARSYLPSATVPTCFNGTATVDNSEFTAPVTYLWSNAQTTQTATGLTPGTYTVVVTDAHGCSTNSTVTISNTLPAVSFVTTQSCTYDEGTVQAVVTGGSAPYTYLWSNGETTQNLTGVPPGTYSVDVTDLNGCTSNASVTTATQVAQTSHFDYPSGLTITSTSQTITDLNGDGKIRIRGVLKFSNNVQYTLTNKTIQFARDLAVDIPDLGQTHSGIIVEIGAKLTATSCNFNSVDLCNAMWEGIQVWGGTGAQVNGTLVLTSSTIRDAQIGVACYRSHLPNLPGTPTCAKGVLTAKSSTFLNNAISVSFHGRGTLTTNTSTIKGCSFTNNALMKDQSRYPGQGMTYFMRLSDISGPAINANTFTANTAFTTATRGTGIYSYNSKYTVESGYVDVIVLGTPPTRNRFFNLTKGIDIYATGAANMSVKIKDNLFSNVQQGVIANSSRFDEISYNSFSSIPFGTAALNTWGIYLSSSSGFITAENSFSTTGSGVTTYTYGMISRNNTLANSKHYRNYFSGNFYAATQLEQNNSNLQLQCNSYSGTNTYDWAITSGTLANQGVNTNGTTTANNTFGTCTTADQSQIYKAASVPAFNYTTSGTAPSCISSGISVFTTLYRMNCPEITTNPCPDCGSGGSSSMIAYYNTLGSAEKSDLKPDVIRSLVAEENLKGLVSFLEGSTIPEDAQLLIPTYIQLGMYAQALEKLEQLQDVSPEVANDLQAYRLLTAVLARGNSLQALRADELSTLNTLAAEGSVPAQAMLTEYTGKDVLHFAERITEGDLVVLSAAETAEQLVVFPNPSSGEVNLRYPFETGQQITVIDVMGRVEREFVLDASTGEVSLHLPAGMFIVLVKSGDTVVQQQRVVIRD